MKDFYTVKEAANILGKCRETIRRQILAGDIYASKNSKKEGYKIPKEEIDKRIPEMTKTEIDETYDFLSTNDDPFVVSLSEVFNKMSDKELLIFLEGVVDIFLKRRMNKE